MMRLLPVLTLCAALLPVLCSAQLAKASVHLHGGNLGIGWTDESKPDREYYFNLSYWTLFRKSSKLGYFWSAGFNYEIRTHTDKGVYYLYTLGLDYWELDLAWRKSIVLPHAGVGLGYRLLRYKSSYAYIEGQIGSFMPTLNVGLKY